MKRSEHSAWLRNLFAMTVIIALFGFAMTPKAARAACTGDCDNIGTVTVSNIVTMINIALGDEAVSDCTPGDANGDHSITVDEILQAVHNALNGCTAPVCGDGVTDTVLGEECDDGGTCIGGQDAGKHCTAEDGENGCRGNGVCIGGTEALAACDPTDSSACPGGGTCRKCVPQGGDGCAANCTNEAQVALNLKPGAVQGDILEPGTSGAVVYNELLGALALPFQEGTTQTLVYGKQRDNQIPAVIIASSVVFPKIDVKGLACACVRGVADKTCGGTLFKADGVTPAVDCTPEFVPGTCSGTTNPQQCTTDAQCPKVRRPVASVCSAHASTACTTDAQCPVGESCLNTIQTCLGGVCANCRVDSDCSDLGGGTCDVQACSGDNPCTFVHGPGNSASGAIDCVSGLQGVDLFYTQDSRGATDPFQCNPANTTASCTSANCTAGGSKCCDDGTTACATAADCPAWTPSTGNIIGLCGDQPAITRSGTGPAGSAIIVNTTAIGELASSCTDSKTPATFCQRNPDIDPIEIRGTPSTLPSITGTASGEMFNINQGVNSSTCGSSGCDQGIAKCCGDGTTACSNDADCGDTLCACPPGFPSCNLIQCSGPITAVGNPLGSCDQLSGSNPSLSGIGLAGVFTSLSTSVVNDIVTTNVQYVQ